MHACLFVIICIVSILIYYSITVEHFETSCSCTVDDYEIVLNSCINRLKEKKKELDDDIENSTA
jgi:hypothetical protein